MFTGTTSPSAELARGVRGFIAMERRVGQGCPASEFLQTTALDPHLRWLTATVLMGDPQVPALLHRWCACANGVAIAAVRPIVPAMRTSFEAIGNVTWTSTSESATGHSVAVACVFPRFHEMQISTCATKVDLSGCKNSGPQIEDLPQVSVSLCASHQGRTHTSSSINLRNSRSVIS